MKKVDMIVDLQYGSTGKGLFAGYLSERGGYDVIINANMPNAGHTCIDRKGNKMVHKILPSGILGMPEFVMLGPGSVFDMDRLHFEVNAVRQLGYEFTVLIHPGAVALEDYHVQMEAELTKKIGSTASGAMAATVEKMSRDPQALVTAGERYDKGEIMRDVYITTHSLWRHTISSANRILAEGSQGYSLSLNGRFYPYCTSRDCTPARFLAEMGIPHVMLDKVYGTARTYPIRVGGNSGPHYPDQDEIKWEDIGQEPERTTVTNRVRRLFTFSMEQIREACEDCFPDAVFLNFCNYIHGNPEEAPRAIDILIEAIDSYAPVKWTGWGPKVTEVMER